MPDLLVSRRLHASTSALRAMSARYSDFPSTKTAKIMDGNYKIMLPSTKSALFMDGSPDLAFWRTLAPPFCVGSAGFVHTSHVYSAFPW